METPVTVEQGKNILLAATELHEGGALLERRHYLMLREVFREHASEYLNTKWFSEWLKVHQPAIVLYFGKKGRVTYEDILNFIRERDARRLQRSLRRMRYG